MANIPPRSRAAVRVTLVLLGITMVLFLITAVIQVLVLARVIT